MAKNKASAPGTRASHSKKDHLPTAKQVDTVDTISFEQSLDISGAAILQQQLSDILRTKTDVALDATKVERADTAALQVLTAFFKDAEAANIKVHWKHTSAPLIKAARLLGLVPSLHLGQG